MPPGGRIAASVGELLWGRSPKAHQPLKAAERQLFSSGVRTKATHSGLHYAQPTAIVNPTRSAGGKLVNLLVETFSPLLRSPGNSGKQHLYSARPTSFKSNLSRASLYTARRSSTGFSAVRPKALPRSTNGMGLQSARNFSSSRPVFDNVIANAPLGLRVLGDKDRLDMRTIRREAKTAHLRKMREKKTKKAKQSNQWHAQQMASVPASLERYFPSVQRTAPTVQLVLPLIPVKEASSLLSHSEAADDSRFFSAMLMSDLRLLSEMHGIHHARMRSLIQSLEVAGCFEVEDGVTGQPNTVAELDEGSQQLVITFYGDRWSLPDVKQVIGCYDDEPTWYQVFNLADVDASCSSGDVQSTIMELPSGSVSVLSSSPALSHTDEEAEYTRVCESLQLPSATSLTCTSGNTSYLWAVEDFLHELDSSQQPSFVKCRI